MAKKQNSAARSQHNRPRSATTAIRTTPPQALLRPLPIHFQTSRRIRVFDCGGLGAIHHLVTRLRLPQAINDHLRLLKRHLPYFESDHVLALCYHILAGGKALQDLQRLRSDPACLIALGVERLPAPSTAGDFLRRFTDADALALQQAINQVRLRVWKRQRPAFRRQAVLDVDGTIVETEARCTAGIGYCGYKQKWGYGPLLISLAQTGEALFVVNRSASGPSHVGAVPWIDRAVALVEPLFDEVWLRGDTDFSLTAQLDRWTAAGVHFIFGYDAVPTLVERAQALSEQEFRVFERQPRYVVKTRPRRRPERVRDQIVHARGYKKITLVEEALAEISYRPGKCARSYRVLILRKKERITRGERVLEERTRYLFYITNDETQEPAALIRFINQRCNQENTIEQLKNGVPAFHAPVNTLAANWAYMIIATLAWNLKAWLGLLTPRAPLGTAIVQMEMKQFLWRFIRVPCQILRQGRRLIYRVVHQGRDQVVGLFASLQALSFP